MLCTGEAEQSYVARTGRDFQNVPQFNSMGYILTIYLKLELQLSPNYFTGITVSSTTFLQNFRTLGLTV